MSQSFTFIDVAGNQAQYIVSEKGQYDDFHWSTDHGDQVLLRRPRKLSIEQGRH
jgi:hypothetical protein